MYFALRGREVQVPNVIGKSQREAESLLEDQGLKIRLPQGQTPAGAVINDQSPAPGTTVKTGQSVRVSLSLGAPPPEKRAGAP
jgi:serine/threonine-protein kinase